MTDEDFLKRRQQARIRLDKLEDEARPENWDTRRQWFNTVYDEAKGDAAAVPWADMAPKPELLRWLAHNSGGGKSAIDIACGLGDNAHALAENGWQTVGFDVAQKAVNWANKRFSHSRLTFTQTDLFNLPTEWQENFALVHEVYTLQALQGTLRQNACAAIAGLVAPLGRLIIHSRIIDEGQKPQGPPWPLTIEEMRNFTQYGLQIAHEHAYDTVRPERKIPHYFIEFMKV